MNGAATIGALISLGAAFVTIIFLFVVFLLLVFINSHAKETRDQLIAINGQLAALRKDLRTASTKSTTP